MTNVSVIEFDFGLDIDLEPIKNEIIEMLEKINDLSYPRLLTDSAPFLPRLDLSCVSKSGIKYLNESALSLNASTVTGFFGAISEGCSGALSLLGGYDSTAQELSMTISVEVERSGSL